MQQTQLSEKDQAWLKHYHQAMKQGLSIHGYAIKYHLSKSTFHAAVKKLRDQGVIPSRQKISKLPAPFVKINPSAHVMEPLPAVTLVLPSGIKLELSQRRLDSATIDFIHQLDLSLRG